MATHYHLFITLLTVSVCGIKDFILHMRFSLDEILEKRIVKTFGRRCCIRHDSTLVDILNVQDAPLFIFSHGDALSRCVMNKRRGNIFLLEDGQFPYYRNYNSFDDHGIRKLRKIIWSVFTECGYVNYYKSIQRVYLFNLAALSSGYDCEKFSGMQFSNIPRSSIDNIIYIFSVQGYPNSKKYNLVFFDSPIDGDASQDSSSYRVIYRSIFDKLKEHKILFRFSPRFDSAREKVLRDVLSEFDNIQIDVWNHGVPWEVVVQRNLKLTNDLVYISQRCTAQISSSILYGLKSRAIVLNRIFINQGVYHPYVVEDNYIFNKYITSRVAKKIGISALVPDSVGDLVVDFPNVQEPFDTEDK